MAHGIKGAAILRGLHDGGPLGALSAGLVGSFSGDEAIIQSGILAPPPPSPLAGKVAGIPILWLAIGGAFFLFLVMERK